MANCNRACRATQKPQPIEAAIGRTLRRARRSGGVHVFFQARLGGRGSRSARRSRCSRRRSMRSSKRPAPPRRRPRCRRCSSERSGGNSPAPRTRARISCPRAASRRRPSRIPRSSSSSTIPTRRAFPAISRTRRRARSRATGAARRACSSRATTRTRRRERVAAGQPTDPPNLWTGVCHTRRRGDAARPRALRRPHRARAHPLGDAHVGLPRRAARS